MGVTETCMHSCTKDRNEHILFHPTNNQNVVRALSARDPSALTGGINDIRYRKATVPCRTKWPRTRREFNFFAIFS